jgi:hypothetical protein
LKNQESSERFLFHGFFLTLVFQVLYTFRKTMLQST